MSQNSSLDQYSPGQLLVETHGQTIKANVFTPSYLNLPRKLSLPLDEFVGPSDELAKEYNTQSRGLGTLVLGPTELEFRLLNIRGQQVLNIGEMDQHQARWALGVIIGLPGVALASEQSDPIMWRGVRTVTRSLAHNAVPLLTEVSHGVTLNHDLVVEVMAHTNQHEY